MATTTYPTKIGIELILPLIVVFGISSALLIYHEAWIGLIINMTAIVGICYVCIHTTYTIEENVLAIKSPLIMPIIIDIQSIQRVQESRDPLSSPAGSLDRLEIIYGETDRVLISPKCKKEFLQQLRALKPEIDIVLRK
ncbi:MAG: hypothetical protein K0R51_3449 [Cytophagaceae bacterium]|jgi:hypothetical protein|nr:hypothetical protein [Cytophagaceae bacterium]